MRLGALLLVLALAGCTAPEAAPAPPADDPSPPRTDAGSATAEGECPRVSILRGANATALPGPLRFRVRIDNCGDAALITDGGVCYHATPGLAVSLGLPEGGRANLYPSDAPAPASGDSTGCLRGAGQATLEPGAVVEYAYAWDGRVKPHCPQRVAGSACEGERAAREGAYELVAGFTHTRDSAFAIETLVLTGPETRRVPVVLVTETYEKSRVDAELPARGVGCADLVTTREPWTATPLRLDAEEVAAVVVREFPQGGFGTFGPDGLALRGGATLAIPSVFDPERVLGVLEDSPEGPRLAGQPLRDGPQNMSSAFEVEHEGRTYSVSERIEARLVGEAHLFGRIAETGC
ncbi:MAG TPA: hypothetical protein VFH78_09640 [Candidatus Thermoplasmatota archaeon]|nr:hypothetical protein [Candidatus Thermoplasmatota archaeon]